MTASGSRRPLPDHPLLQDRERLEAILDVMYIQIQKVTHPFRAAAGRGDAGARHEHALVGGESPDDVLQTATLALLSYPPSHLTTTWEALAVGIARNKAKDAIRRATTGRTTSSADSEDAGDPETNVVPLPTGGAGQNPIDSLPADGDTLEAEFIVSRQQQILLRLARELLDDRERQIFFEIHHLGSGRAEVGRKLGLTGQRVGQIYRKVAQQLLDAARDDPTFRTLSEFAAGGSDDRIG
jgi:RNA polymerase sigma factor (sigma-70 family)